MVVLASVEGAVPRSGRNKPYLVLYKRTQLWEAAEVGETYSRLCLDSIDASHKTSQDLWYYNKLLLFSPAMFENCGKDSGHSESGAIEGVGKPFSGATLFEDPRV